MQLRPGHCVLSRDIETFPPQKQIKINSKQMPAWNSNKEEVRVFQLVYLTHFQLEQMTYKEWQMPNRSIAPRNSRWLHESRI